MIFNVFVEKKINLQRQQKINYTINTSYIRSLKVPKQWSIYLFRRLRYFEKNHFVKKMKKNEKKTLT